MPRMPHTTHAKVRVFIELLNSLPLHAVELAEVDLAERALDRVHVDTVPVHFHHEPIANEHAHLAGLTRLVVFLTRLVAAESRSLLIAVVAFAIDVDSRPRVRGHARESRHAADVSDLDCHRAVSILSSVTAFSIGYLHSHGGVLFA